VEVPDADDVGGLLVRNVPVVVIAVTVVSWYLAANGIRTGDVYTNEPLNPLPYLSNALFHLGWDHFWGNVRMWIPLGTLLTWLTSNRHVLGMFFAIQALTVIATLAVGTLVVGMSGVILGFGAAILVRSTGVALQDSSAETVQSAVLGVFVPALFGFLFVAILRGGTDWISHFGHFFGFLFGGAIEAMFVFSEHESGGEGGAGEPFGRMIR
jgi:membrane associated rhomboid family serine protease